MAEFREYLDGDDRDGLIGDREWFGYDALTAPNKLVPGLAAMVRNMRCRSGEWAPMGGIRDTGWLNPQYYPFHTVVASGYAGTVTAGNLTRSGGPVFTVDDVNRYARFGSGRVVRVTAFVDLNNLTVEDVANNAAPGNGAFVFTTKRESNYQNQIQAAGETVRGGGLYSNPNGREYVVILTDKAAWFARDGEPAFRLEIPGGIDEDDVCWLVQAFDRLLLFRGLSKPNLEWDGDALSSWEEIPQTSDVPGYTGLPRTRNRPLYYKDRMLVCFDNDTHAVSDPGSYRDYNHILNEARLNAGKSDSFVAYHPFGASSVLVFYRHSIYRLDGFEGDLSELSARLISRSVGCGAAETICDVGNNVFWVDAGGRVWALSQVEEDRMELRGVPLSWCVEKDWQSLGARRVDLWRAVYWDGYYLLAFVGNEPALGLFSAPLRFPNLVAVFDTTKPPTRPDLPPGQWVSVDQRDLIGYRLEIAAWARTTRWGLPALVIVHGATGAVQHYGYDDADLSGGTEYRYGTDFLSRGYDAAPLEQEQAAGVYAEVGTLNPEWFLHVLPDGPGRQSTIIDGRKHNRIRYTTWNRPDWDPSNANRDYNAPGREDYLLVLGDDFRGMPEFTANAMQRWSVHQSLSLRGRWFQVRIINRSTTGYPASRLVISACGVSARQSGPSVKLLT